jgi:glycosyltransferase involved in cell wall biosynthesis
MFVDSRIQILPNPTPPSHPHPRNMPLTSKTQFLYVGQLEEHKGIRHLLQAFESLGEDVELHVAGEGSLSEYVADRAQRDRRMNFHGFISLNHLFKLLQIVDAVIVPSICYENSPTVIYEAYLVGVPIIASRLGGIPELVRDGETGLLVSPGDEQALRQAMLSLHLNRDAWWQKGDTIRVCARQYSIKNHVDQLERYMEELTG